MITKTGATLTADQFGSREGALKDIKHHVTSVGANFEAAYAYVRQSTHCEPCCFTAGDKEADPTLSFAFHFAQRAANR